MLVASGRVIRCVTVPLTTCKISAVRNVVTNTLEPCMITSRRSPSSCATPVGAAAAGGEGEEPAVGAGHVERVVAGVVGQAPRRRAHGTAREDRALQRIDRDQRPTAAQDHVDTTRLILHDAAGLVAGLELDRVEHGLAHEIDDPDHVPIGVGGHGGVAVRRHEQRAAADGRRLRPFSVRLRGGRSGRRRGVDRLRWGVPSARVRAAEHRRDRKREHPDQSGQDTTRFHTSPPPLLF